MLPGISIDISESAYNELRKLAASVMRFERRRITMSPTALLHEALLRLSSDGLPTASGPIAKPLLITIMRNLLIDLGRRRTRLAQCFASSSVETGTAPSVADSYATQAAVRKLSAIDQRQAAIVELRVAAGCSNEEIAHRLGCSVRTVAREWSAARLWLRRELGE